MGRNRKKNKAKAAKVDEVDAATAAAQALAKANEADLSHPEGMKAAGNKSFLEGDLEGAIAWFTSAINADSSQKAYFSNRSVAYCKLGGSRNVKRALADAEMCIQLEPDWAKGYVRQATALKALHRIDDAKAAIAKALELGDSTAATLELSEALSKMKASDYMPEGDDEDEGDKDKFELLEDWLRSPVADDSTVAEFPLLYMKRYSENNRGVHCRVNIPPDTRIMTIPRRYLITVEMGKAGDIGRAMVENDVDITAQKHCYLCVYVMADRRNPDSYYQPYYNILPTAYPNMPIFWSEEELSWLQGSYILQQVKDRKRNISADMDEISSVAPEFGDFALEEFMWARMMVASRNFGVTIDGTKTDALVPYADMLNHYRPRESSWTFNQDEYCFTITSLKSLKKGQQVYDSYGKKCNSRFLLNYGFSIESNRDPNGQCHDEVRVPFSLKPPSEDPSYNLKKNLLNGASTTREIRPGSWYLHKTSLEAFSFCRFIHAKGTEVMLLPQIGYSTDLGKEPIKPISVDNEVEVLKTLRDTYRRQLTRYKHSMEEDQKVIADNLYEFGSNHRNAIVHLINEKRVCHHFIDLAAICIPLLQMQWKDCKRVTNKMFREANDIKRYITTVVHPLVKKRASSEPTAVSAEDSAARAEYLLSGAYKADCVAVLPGTEGETKDSMIEELTFDDDE